MEEWANRNLMKFIKGKSSVLHLAWRNPIQQCGLGTDWLETSSAKKIFGSWWRSSWPQTNSVPLWWWGIPRHGVDLECRQKLEGVHSLPLFDSCENMQGGVWSFWATRSVYARQWIPGRSPVANTSGWEGAVLILIPAPCLSWKSQKIMKGQLHSSRRWIGHSVGLCIGKAC